MKSLFYVLLIALVTSNCGVYSPASGVLNESSTEQQEQDKQSRKSKIIAAGSVVTAVFATTCLIPRVNKPCRAVVTKVKDMFLSPQQVAEKALKEGKWDKIAALIKKGKITHKDKLPTSGQTLIKDIFLTRNIDAIESAIKHGDISPDYILSGGESGRTLVEEAFVMGEGRIIKAVIEKVSDLSKIGDNGSLTNGRTLLEEAIITGDKEVVEMVLDRNITSNFINSATAEHPLEFIRNEMIQVYSNRGDDEGFKGLLVIMETLLAKGADPNLPGVDGGAVRLLRPLIEQGSSMDDAVRLLAKKGTKIPDEETAIKEYVDEISKSE